MEWAGDCSLASRDGAIAGWLAGSLSLAGRSSPCNLNLAARLTEAMRSHSTSRISQSRKFGRKRGERTYLLADLVTEVI